MSAESSEYFQPITSSALSRLRQPQIDQFNRLGYISGLTLYDKSEIIEKRNYIDSLLEQIGPESRYAINCFQARLSGLWDICCESRLLDYVEDIIGPDIICWASHLFCKAPFDEKKVPWHQDAVYWHLSPQRTVTVWLAIDDSDAENSAMQFLPASHVKGPLPSRKAGTDAILNIETENTSQLMPAHVNVLAAGQFSLHADMLVHGSESNRSNRRRCGLTIRYCPSFVRMTEANWARGVEPIVCRGSNDGYWQHHPRPQSDQVDLEKKPLNIGGN